MPLRSPVLLAIVALGMATPSALAQQGRKVPVEASVIVAAPFEVALTAAAELTADESVILRSQIDGRIVDIPFTEGTRVEKGDILFVLDDGLLEAQRAEADAALKLARQNAERAKSLFSQGAGTERVRDESEANVRMAEARLAMASERLAYTRIRAPFAGLVGFRSVSVGAYAKAGEDLAELVAIDLMKVSFDVPERYLSAISEGQKVEVIVDALASEAFAGKLVTISPRVTAAGRSLRLRASVDNSSGRLRPGLFARANLEIAERAEALLVPESAIVPQAEKRLVFKVTDGKAVMTEVELGLRRAGKVEVTKGLASGDIVVSAGQLKLRDGSAVTIVGGDAVGAENAGTAPPEGVQKLGSGS
jgi:membrane fusion protein (multidrug efflux system)